LVKTYRVSELPGHEFTEGKSSPTRGGLALRRGVKANDGMVPPSGSIKPFSVNVLRFQFGTRKNLPPSLKAKVAVEALTAHKITAQIAQNSLLLAHDVSDVKARPDNNLFADMR
jgi:hypothetical protein